MNTCRSCGRKEGSNAQCSECRDMGASAPITADDAVATLETAIALIDEGHSAEEVMEYLTIQGRAVLGGQDNRHDGR